MSVIVGEAPLSPPLARTLKNNIQCLQNDEVDHLKKLIHEATQNDAISHAALALDYASRHDLLTIVKSDAKAASDIRQIHDQVERWNTQYKPIMEEIRSHDGWMEFPDELELDVRELEESFPLWNILSETITFDVARRAFQHCTNGGRITKKTIETYVTQRTAPTHQTNNRRKKKRMRKINGCTRKWQRRNNSIESILHSPYNLRSKGKPETVSLCDSQPVKGQDRDHDEEMMQVEPSSPADKSAIRQPHLDEPHSLDSGPNATADGLETTLEDSVSLPYQRHILSADQVRKD